MTHLLETPVLWLPVTIAIYLLAFRLYLHSGKSPLLNPTLLGIAAVVSLLLVTGTPYQSYFQGSGILHYVLGTAVVSLAIPLHRNLVRLKGDAVILGGALFTGSLTSALSGVLIGSVLGVSNTLLLSILPKSATAAVSIEISRSIGGIPAMTVWITILTGVTGAVLGPYILNALGVMSPSARGVALGTVSHGIGTARAFTENELTGCWATIAMCIGCILTVLIAPLLAAFL